MSDYPEHDKLKEIQPLSQAIGEFLEWCGEEGRDIFLATPHPFGEGMVPVNTSIERLLAQHFGIDLDKIEAEKRQMLDHMRKLNEED